jgi:Rad3-related DNA helicase
MTYKLPHPLDRPGQQESLDWILNSDKKYLILRAPTGFGKSPLAAACSIDFRTIALVLHKSLQSANYMKQYDFEILYGKSNYPCIGRKPNLNYTADDCGITSCDCPYQKQKRYCLDSLRVSLNYAKFLMSRAFNEAYEPQYLFLDEAHNLPNIVKNFVGLTLNWNNEFLKCNGELKPKIASRLNYTEAMVLLRQCARAIDRNKPDQQEDLERWRRWKRISQRLSVTNSLLSSGSLLDWYYETDHDRLIIKPLTAKYHFKQLFGVSDKVVLMSATIRPTIAERLGLDDGEWDYHEVTNPWPAPLRPIYDLGGPAINYKSSDKDRLKQAQLIASILDINKSGLIHVTSKSQAASLLDLLTKIDSPNYHKQSLHIPSLGLGTEGQYQEWADFRHPGAYCISWNSHEGVDYGEDDIAVVAKTPYVSFGDNYERACKDYDEQWYLEQAAMKLEQACGRIRRGKPEHYLPGAKQVFLADSSWHRLTTLLSNDFKNSIRKWNGK